MLERVLPDGVSWAESFDDPPEAVLLPGEEAVVARAVGKRRREYTTTRWCARRALAGLGFPDVAIGTGERGEPRWPAGVVGSLTHCEGYRAAAVAFARAGFRSLGVDAEPAGPLPPDVVPLVMSPSERRMVTDRQARLPEVPWDRVLFSAKESVYKAWYPLTGAWLGFEEAEVTLEATGTWRARLLVAAPPDGPAAFHGRWAATTDLVVTATAVRGEAAGPA